MQLDMVLVKPIHHLELLLVPVYEVILSTLAATWTLELCSVKSFDNKHNNLNMEQMLLDMKTHFSEIMPSAKREPSNS